MTPQPSSETAALAGFDDFAARMLKEWKIPGVAVLVVRGDQTLLMKGYGLRDVEAGLPMDAETVFPLASVSKAFTAASIGILVDRGLLDWDRPIREYIPTFKMYDSFTTERLTVRDMLSHRSGLPRHELMWYGSPFSRQEIFERLRYLEPSKDLRTTFLYNNLMYASAGWLLQQLTGITWEDFVQNEIFTPLGMTRTTTSYDRMKAMGDLTAPYKKEKGKTVRTEFYDRGPKDPTGPAGAVKSCLVDLAKWVTLQLNGGEACGVRLLSAASLEQMHTPSIREPGGMTSYRELGETFYAMGWSVGAYRGVKMVEHGGNINGITTHITLLPDEKIGVVALTNLEGASLPMLLTFNLFDRLLGLEPVDWNGRYQEEKKQFEKAEKQGRSKSHAERARGTKPSHPLAAYLGEYEHPGYGKLQVSQTEKGLHLRYNLINTPLEHYHYDIFEGLLKDFDLHFKVRFDMDMQGKITGLFIPLESSVRDIYFTHLPDRSLFDPAVLAKYAGNYHVAGMEVTVTLRGKDQLTASAGPLGDLELMPEAAGKFSARGNPGLRVDFVLGEDGLAETIEISMMGGAVFSGPRIKA